MNLAYTFLIVLFTGSVSLHQNKVSGTYSNAFGEKIIFYEDSTFKYTWNFDLMGSWTKGKWKVQDKKLLLEIIPIYDTLIYLDANQSLVRSLTLSDNEKPEMISAHDHLIHILTSGGQNTYLPNNLFQIKGNRLIIIKNGRPEIQKVRSLTTDKYHTWFVKNEE